MTAIWTWSGFSPAPIHIAPTKEYEETEIFAGRLWVTRISDAALAPGERMSRSYNLSRDELQKQRSGRWFVSYDLFTTEYYNGVRSRRVTRVFALWPVLVLLCASAAFLLRSGIIARRRAVARSCLACGYSLAGIAATTACPECGQRRETAA